MSDYHDQLATMARLLDNAVQQKQRLVLVIGNGYHYLPIITRDDVIKYSALEKILSPDDLRQLRQNSPSSRVFYPLLQQAFATHRDAIDQRITSLSDFEKDREAWRVYQIWREFTSTRKNLNADYRSVAYLLKRRMVDSIITTNYDLGLETLFYELQITPRRNPCLSDSEAEWHCQGYYEKECHSDEYPILWKIHGDLAFMGWSPIECNCIHLIPDNCPPGTPFTRRSYSGTQLASRHYHDYGNFNRSMFAKEADAASYYVEHVGPSVRRVALIVVLGFTGHYGTGTDKDEEIAPVLAQRAAAGFPVFTILAGSGRIARPHSFLWDRLDEIGNAIQPTIPQQQTIGEILTEVIRMVPELFQRFEDFSKWWDDSLDTFQKEADYWTH
ncbi:MAG: hypothetical protein A2Y72_04135 [Chloroflexi bacterium RBG_13_53_26]|nr:MAG: hypothetical protein A2Y72_04135 [Chloroflexi bacterium RBG_13_53_26]